MSATDTTNQALLVENAELRARLEAAEEMLRAITERQQAEATLSWNAALFSKIIEQAPGGVYVMDCQLRVQAVNTQALPVFATVQPVIGRALGEVAEILWGQELGRECTALVRHTLETGERYVSPRFNHHRQDIGVEEAYEWETQRITLPDGQCGVVCYFQNVTVRERAAKALRESEERLRLATGATEVGIWEWNIHTNQVRWDAQMFRIYGIQPTPDGFVDYQTWAMAVLPEDVENDELILQNTLFRCGRSTRTFRIVRRDSGECRHINAVQAVRPNVHGDAEWMVGTNLDVTEQKRAGAKLRSEVAERKQAEEQVRLLNRDLEQRVAERVAELASKARLLAERNVEIELARLTLEEKAAELESANRALIVEVTERRRVEQQLRELNDTLEQRVLDRTEALREADRRKDDFLAMLGHELRNPLAAITNAVKLIQEPGSDPGTAEWAHGIIERQSDNLRRIVDDLLDVARITSGRVELRKQSVDLAQIISRAVEVTRPFLEEKKHELTLSLSPNRRLRVEADPTRLEQCIVNLLVNAAKYTPKCGRITITEKHVGTEVILAVSDNGIGIGPEVMPYIFDLFIQASRSSDRAQGGLGIGLTLCQQLINLHGGSISAQSAGLGQGAEFTLRLPALCDPVAEPSPRVASPAPETALRLATPHRVLVVDDNLDAARTLSRLLSGRGHEVCTAYDGLGALKAAHEFKPDIFLLDLGLPDIDGYELARRLRAEGFAETLMIAISGYAQESDQAKARAAGFNHHFAKPVDFSELVCAFR